MTNQQFLKIVLLVLFPFFLCAQTSKSFNKSAVYEDLKNAFIKNKGNDGKQLYYANEYLKRARATNSRINISRGYYILAHMYEGAKAIQLLDYSIAYAKNINDLKMPAYSYLKKGYELKKQFRFDEALDNFFIAEKIAKNNNLDFYYHVKHSIGILRSEELGQVDEALELYLECFNYLKDKDIRSPSYAIDFHNVLFALADAHRSLNTLDSTSFYNKLGYRESRATNDLDYIPLFILNEGANQVLKKNYKSALDSIYKALPQIIEQKNYGNVLASYYYLGLAHAGSGNRAKAIQNFVKVDSMYGKTKRITPEFISGYPFLISHYKERNDKENQLKYVSKLMSIDSTLQKNYKELSKKMQLEYDTPHLIAEKEALIQSLEEKQSASYIWIVVLVVGVAGLIGYQFYLKKQHQNRFEAILNPPIPIAENSTVLETQLTTPDAKESQVQQSLSNEIVLELLEKLTVFENDKGFIENTISIQKLALKLNTNTKYLSKVINEQKGKTFVQYINELRVNEAVLQLQVQPILQNYTIASLASEFGFNSAEAFSAAFYKKYKIKPSFFIKELSKTRAS
jgi:AraC-like DNA-binding protein